jgi:hypothetical protein
MDRTILKNELENILKKNPQKTLIPEEVVAAAKNPNNPLHTQFTWDDTEAAAKYRLEEARSLIRSISVLITPNQTEPTRAFVHTSPSGYKPIEIVLNQKELRERFIQDMLDELDRIKRKAQHITELASVWKEIQKTQSKFQNYRKAPSNSTELERLIKGGTK